MKKKFNVCLLLLTSCLTFMTVSCGNDGDKIPNLFQTADTQIQPPVFEKSDISYRKGGTLDLMVKMDLKGGTLKYVKLNGEAATVTDDYLYNGTYLILNASYLNKLKVTTYVVEVANEGGNATFSLKISDSNPIEDAEGAPVINSNSLSYVKFSLDDVSVDVDYKKGTILKVSVLKNSVYEDLVLGSDYYSTSNKLFVKNTSLDKLAIGQQRFKLVTNGGEASFNIQVKPIEYTPETLPPSLAETNFKHYKTYNVDLVIPVDLKNTEVQTLKNGETILNVNSYDASVKNNKLTIFYSYLDNLSAGDYDFKLINTAGKDCSFVVKVIDGPSTKEDADAPTLNVNSGTYKLGSKNNLEIKYDLKGEVLVAVKLDDVVVAGDDEFTFGTNSIIVPNAKLESFLKNTTHTYKFITRGGEVTYTLTVEDEDTTNKLPLNSFDESTLYKYTYHGITEDTMPVGAYIGPQKFAGVTNCQDLAHYQEVKESGVNTIYDVTVMYDEAGELVKQQIIDNLELCSEAGVTYIPRDEGLASAAAKSDEAFLAMFNRYAGYKSFGGFFAGDFDEPGVAKFEPISKVYDRKKKVGLNDYFTYTNLFPSYADGASFDEAHPSTTFAQYLSQFLATVSPNYLSVDFYPYVNPSSNTTDHSANRMFFENLYTLKENAKAKKIPFWHYACSSGHFGFARDITYEGLAWTVNAGLAYGAKGLKYFCYQLNANPADNQHAQWAADEATYGTSFINWAGNKTKVYGYAQKINKQVHKMEKVLMNSNMETLYVYGSSPETVYGNTAVSGNLVKELNKVNTSSNLLVSVFNNHGKTAVFVMNNCMNAGATFNIDFDSYVEANVYAPSGDTSFKSTNSGNISLGAGEACLIELTNYVRG